MQAVPVSRAGSPVSARNLLRQRRAPFVPVMPLLVAPHAQIHDRVDAVHHRYKSFPCLPVWAGRVRVMSYRRNRSGRSSQAVRPPDALQVRSGSGAAAFYRRAGKRMLDVALVLMAAPLVLPVIVLLAGGIALDGGRPFYCQVRVGRGGIPYRMWKLRTMVHDADARLKAYLEADPEARAEWARSQKLGHDPRITRLGRLLRRSSLDELPQLWNVLRGDMSLVGPRPMLASQRRLYPGTDYYALRPGITGPWQVSSRNESAFVARARFDALYNRRLSLGTDLRLILATLAVVWRATGH